MCYYLSNGAIVIETCEGGEVPSGNLPRCILGTYERIGIGRIADHENLDNWDKLYYEVPTVP